MNDWADYALGKLQQQRENQRLKDQKFVEKQKLKKARGIPLWQQTREAVKNNCEALNTKSGENLLAFEVTNNMELSVRSLAGQEVRELHANFDGDLGKLIWTSGAKTGSWELAVSEESGDVYFQQSWALPPATPAKMAKEMLDALLFD